MNVRYRNTTKLHLKLIRFNYDDFLKSNRWSPLQLDEPTRRSFVRQPAVKQWSIDLPKTEDYRERIEKVVVPQDVPRGCYVLIASSDASFADDRNQLSLSEVWVSRLAMVVRTDQSLNQLEALVTDNQTGVPIVGASVKVWQLNQRQAAVQGESLKTDSNGIARLEATQRERLYLVGSHNGDQIASGQPLYFNRFEPGDGRSTQTQFFTDRAIYRPGQTIQYKGICFANDPQAVEYKTIAGQAVTVVLRDMNGEEVERRTHQTNRFGSFSGSFTATRNRLMGNWSLQTENGPQGWQQVQVEEYKRPKFRVEVTQPTAPAKLGDKVTVSGKATAYTGVAINDAKVSWRVVREVRYPIWWMWRCWWCPVESNSAEIAHGTTVTKADGSFEIAFDAKRIYRSVLKVNRLSSSKCMPMLPTRPERLVRMTPACRLVTRR